MLNIDWIRQQVKDNIFYFSRHGDQERQHENLTVTEIRESLLNGMIVEQYPDTGRGKSCLVAGFTSSGIPAHSVCGRRGEQVVIITTYIPQPPKFKNPYVRG
jgi:hypothetical protein